MALLVPWWLHQLTSTMIPIIVLAIGASILYVQAAFRDPGFIPFSTRVMVPPNDATTQEQPLWRPCYTCNVCVDTVAVAQSTDSCLTPVCYTT
jgi:hypothetical protein